MAVKRLINRVSVDAAFFKKLSPAENLSFAARLYGLDAGEARRKSVEIMARLGIGEKRLGRPVEEMSRGMQQKVAIARAILTSPTLLLLDEPTTGLDPRSKLDVQTFIEELRAEHDATILLTTHDLAEAERLCGRIGILAGGRLAVEDTPERLKARVALDHGLPPTLESVFMQYTGRSLDDDVEEGEADPALEGTQRCFRITSPRSFIRIDVRELEQRLRFRAGFDDQPKRVAPSAAQARSATADPPRFGHSPPTARSSCRPDAERMGRCVGPSASLAKETQP